MTFRSIGGALAVLAAVAASGACGSSPGSSALHDGGSLDTTSGVLPVDAVGSDRPSVSRRICDGSSSIRLAYRVYVPTGREPAFTAVLWELGSDFLYVDGGCHYWVQEPSLSDKYKPWRTYREGILTAAQETALHDLVWYDDVASGASACVGPLAVDASPIQLWDGATVHVCNGNLQVAADWPMRSALFAAGSSMTGSVRVEVGQNPYPDDAKIYAWPLEAAPATYEIQYAQSTSAGQSSLITDAAEVDALRTLRDQAIADATVAPGHFYDAICVQPKGWVIAVRDDLPFTNRSDGLWSPP